MKKKVQSIGIWPVFRATALRIAMKHREEARELVRAAGSHTTTVEDKNGTRKFPTPPERVLENVLSRLVDLAVEPSSEITRKTINPALMAWCHKTAPRLTVELIDAVHTEWNDPKQSAKMRRWLATFEGYSDGKTMIYWNDCSDYALAHEFLKAHPEEAKPPEKRNARRKADTLPIERIAGNIAVARVAVHEAIEAGRKVELSL